MRSCCTAGALSCSFHGLTAIPDDLGDDLRARPADLRLSSAPRARRFPGPWLAVGLAAALLFAFYSLVMLDRVDRLLAPAYDQAFFEELVWNVGHGGGFATAFTPGSYLGIHFQPLLVFPALLELVWPDQRLLVLMNAFAIAATAPAGYLLARELLPARPWLAVALAAPLPAWSVMEQAARSYFHPEAIALPAALLAAWAGIRGRPILCCCLACIALVAKEDQSYTVLVVGLLVAAGGRRRLGLLLMGTAVVYGSAILILVMPAIRGGIRSDVANYYSWLLTARPAEVAQALVHPLGWLVLGGLLVGMLGLPLLRPTWLALVLPPFIADLLSRHALQPDLRLHYGLLVVLPVFVAGLMGARRLEAGAAWVPALAFALPALLIGALTTPFAVPHEPPALSRLLACTTRLPREAPVAADDPVSPPLAARHRLAATAAARPGDYVVVDRTGREPSYVDRAGRERVITGLSEGGRSILCDDGRFQLWSPPLAD